MLQCKSSQILISEFMLQVLYETGGSKVEVVNIETMTALAFSVPFNISSLSLSAVDKWLLEDTTSK